ncbi:DUF1456 family protein [Luteibaculum oceani]|uniref:DUF1456 family protein n=2 Tax=Luteibaculum oceani TaxID=1294296 RepID=A0A5C6UY71_9FLAO|nr:DUF1456 family protein [Luteibaculum oceani]
MNNNYILRSIRYTYNYSDEKMLKIFSLGDFETTVEDIQNFLAKDDAENFQPLNDKKLAHFLNGLITLKRGPKEGEAPKAESQLNNNLILRKLKIALQLTDDDIVDIMKKVDLEFSKHEVNAFFRKPGHKHYRECKDQFLRNFLRALNTKK